MSTYKVNIPAGPLGSNEEAQKIGPKIAAAHHGRFTGQWTTVVQGAMSVVEVELPVEHAGPHSFKTNVLAGPLSSNDEAQKIGSNIAASYGAKFTGRTRSANCAAKFSRLRDAPNSQCCRQDTRVGKDCL